MVEVARGYFIKNGLRVSARSIGTPASAFNDSHQYTIVFSLKHGLYMLGSLSYLGIHDQRLRFLFAIHVMLVSFLPSHGSSGLPDLGTRYLAVWLLVDSFVPAPIR